MCNLKKNSKSLIDAAGGDLDLKQNMISRITLPQVSENTAEQNASSMQQCSIIINQNNYKSIILGRSVR